MANKGLRIVKKAKKSKPFTVCNRESKYPTNIGKKDFVMDKDTFLNWYH